MANERFNSWLIDEGSTRQITYGPVGRTLLTAAVLTIIGVVAMWTLFLLLSIA